MEPRRKLHPVTRLLETLEAENIRLMLIGMAAAIVQGVMETTLDVDLWMDLPPRQYMRVQDIAPQDRPDKHLAHIIHIRNLLPCRQALKGTIATIRISRNS